MSLVASDLVAVSWDGQAENDTSDYAWNLVLTTRRFAHVAEIGASASGVEVLSSNAGDTTQTVTVRGWSSAGKLIDALANPYALNGTTAVGIDGSWLRLTYCTISASTTGTITFRKSGGGATLATIDSTAAGGARTAQRMFVFAYATQAGITRYDKFMWYNKNSSFAAISPVSRLTADPQTRIRIGAEASSGVGADTTTRLTAPGGISFVDDNVDQTGPANIPTLDTWAIWVEFASTADDPNAPFGDSFTAQITAQSI